MSGCRLSCPTCGHQRNLCASDVTILAEVVYRRRKCQGCGANFSTVETHMPAGMRHVYRYTSKTIKERAAANQRMVFDALRTMGQPAELAEVPLDHKERRRKTRQAA